MTSVDWPSILAEMPSEQLKAELPIIADDLPPELGDWLRSGDHWPVQSIEKDRWFWCNTAEFRLVPCKLPGNWHRMLGGKSIPYDLLEYPSPKAAWQALFNLFME